jgi:predicted nucleic acid-binding protein
MKVYFENTIESGRARPQLKPDQMNAVQLLMKAAKKGKLKLFTSEETNREQSRVPPAHRAKLVEARTDVPLVSENEKLLGFHNQMDRLGTVSVSPFVTEYVDADLFNSFTKLGLEEADARHLMYAVHDGCDRFVTVDGDFLSARRQQLESLCRGLKITTPVELVAELKPWHLARNRKSKGWRKHLRREKVRQRRAG